jgi:hypothetical protein
MLTPTAQGAVNARNDKNDKEQSGAETVKIASRINKTWPDFNCSSPRDGAILNEPDRN